MTATLMLTPGRLSLEDIHAIWSEAPRLTLPAEAIGAMDASAAIIARIIAEGDPAYGINTGFGKLAQTRVADTDLETLQKNLILSHAVGVGEPLSADVVRLIVALKIASLARGYSGIRSSVVQTLLDIYNAGIIPWIPAKGSVGASGDL